MSSFIGYEAQAATPEIQTDNSAIFVIPSQVVATASATGVTYNMSVTAMEPSDTSAIKYDYVFDYNLDASGAASFCNAFDVSGANAYSTSKNDQATAVLSTPNDVKTILLAAFTSAVAEAGQTPQSGAPTKATLSGSETINATLTSVLQQFVNAYTAASFDSSYYSAAVGAQSDGLSTTEISIDLDDNTGVSALAAEAAATSAVAVGGAIRADATKLHLQLPASNLRLYENSSTSVLSNALLLKGGDTVVIGFSVTLDNPQAVCANSSGDVTNSGLIPNSHPSQLEAATLNVDIADGPSAIRAVEIAVRLHMPGSGALAGVRAA